MFNIWPEILSCTPGKAVRSGCWPIAWANKSANTTSAEVTDNDLFSVGGCVARWDDLDVTNGVTAHSEQH